jgi:hypothetical protein
MIRECFNARQATKLGVAPTQATDRRIVQLGVLCASHVAPYGFWLAPGVL